MKVKGLIYWSVFGILLLMLSVGAMVAILSLIDAIFDVIPRETSSMDVVAALLVDIIMVLMLAGWSTEAGKYNETRKSE